MTSRAGRYRQLRLQAETYSAIAQAYLAALDATTIHKLDQMDGDPDFEPETEEDDGSAEPAQIRA